MDEVEATVGSGGIKLRIPKDAVERYRAEEVEKIARIYCVRRGLNPDEVIGMADSDYPDSEWWVHLPRWHQFKDKAREHIDWAAAIKEGL